jgi:hypothetical protein
MGKSKLGNFPPEIEDILNLRIVPEFEQLTKLANNRMIMATFRYNLLKKGHNISDYNLCDTIRTKLKLYEEEKRLDCLIDVFNYVRIEFIKATYLGILMNSIDDGEHASPSI